MFIFIFLFKHGDETEYTNDDKRCSRVWTNTHSSVRQHAHTHTLKISSAKNPPERSKHSSHFKPNWIPTGSNLSRATDSRSCGIIPNRVVLLGLLSAHICLNGAARVKQEDHEQQLKALEEASPDRLPTECVCVCYQMVCVCVCSHVTNGGVSYIRGTLTPCSCVPSTNHTLKNLNFNNLASSFIPYPNLCEEKKKKKSNTDRKHHAQHSTWPTASRIERAFLNPVTRTFQQTQLTSGLMQMLVCASFVPEHDSLWRWRCSWRLQVQPNVMHFCSVWRTLNATSGQSESRWNWHTGRMMMMFASMATSSCFPFSSDRKFRLRFVEQKRPNLNI